jgi:hypothetical protein
VGGTDAVQMSTHFRIWFEFVSNTRPRGGFGGAGKPPECDGGAIRVVRTFEKYQQYCAKEDSFTLVRCIKSRASGEDEKRGSCNQGWGLGTFFLPCHQEIWIREMYGANDCRGGGARLRGFFKRMVDGSGCGRIYKENHSGRRVSALPKQGYPQIEAQRDV